MRGFRPEETDRLVHDRVFRFSIGIPVHFTAVSASINPTSNPGFPSGAVPSANASLGGKSLHKIPLRPLSRQKGFS
jgi:siroheme synthase